MDMNSLSDKAREIINNYSYEERNEAFMFLIEIGLFDREKQIYNIMKEKDHFGSPIGAVVNAFGEYLIDRAQRYGIKV